MNFIYILKRHVLLKAVLVESEEGETISNGNNFICKENLALKWKQGICLSDAMATRRKPHSTTMA